MAGFQTFLSGRISTFGDSFEKRVAVQAADSAVSAVRLEHAFAELALMQALLKLAGRVAPPDVGLRGLGRRRGVKAHESRLVHADRECQAGRIVPDDIDRPRGLVEAWNDAVKVDERRLTGHRQAQADVLSMPRVDASVAVSQEAVLPERVVVRGVLTLEDPPRANNL